MNKAKLIHFKRLFCEYEGQNSGFSMWFSSGWSWTHSQAHAGFKCGTCNPPASPSQGLGLHYILFLHIYYIPVMWIVLSIIHYKEGVCRLLGVLMSYPHLHLSVWWKTYWQSHWSCGWEAFKADTRISPDAWGVLALVPLLRKEQWQFGRVGCTVLWWLLPQLTSSDEPRGLT